MNVGDGSARAATASRARLRAAATATWCSSTAGSQPSRAEPEPEASSPVHRRKPSNSTCLHGHCVGALCLGAFVNASRHSDTRRVAHTHFPIFVASSASGHPVGPACKVSLPALRPCPSFLIPLCRLTYVGLVSHRPAALPVAPRQLSHIAIDLLLSDCLFADKCGDKASNKARLASSHPMPDLSSAGADLKRRLEGASCSAHRESLDRYSSAQVWHDTCLGRDRRQLHHRHEAQGRQMGSNGQLHHE